LGKIINPSLIFVLLKERPKRGDHPSENCFLGVGDVNKTSHPVVEKRKKPVRRGRRGPVSVGRESSRF